MGTEGATTIAGQVEDVRHSLAGLCRVLDPLAVPLPEVGALWSSFDVIERLAAGAKCRLAARVEESKAWQGDGARSAAEWMASRSGTTTGRSRAALETSKALGDLSDTDAALAAGELSDQQAEALAAAAKADPGAEGRLLELARRAELRVLREEAARVRARAEDEGARARRLHDQRSLRTWRGPDGSWNLVVRNTPEAGAELDAALAPLRESIFNAARRAGRHETAEAYGADALAELVRRAVGADDLARGRASTGPGAAGTPTGGTATGPGAATTARGTEPGVEPKLEGRSAAEAGGGDGGAGGDHAGGDGTGAGQAGGDGTGAGHAGAGHAGAGHAGGDGTGAGHAGAGHAGAGHAGAGHAGAGHAEAGHAANDPASGRPGGSPPAGAPAGPGDASSSRRAPRSRRPDTKIIVLIDYEALKRGRAEAGEICEISGAGPISVDTARSMMTDAFGAAIVTNGVDVFTVAHLGRSVTEHQRSALEARGYHCEVPGCGARRGLEIDHIDDWHQTFRTKLDCLCWLCRAHHFDKTHLGARLEGPPGSRRWIPPRRATGPEPPASSSAA